MTEAVVRTPYFSEHTVLVSNETAGSWFWAHHFSTQWAVCESVRTWLVGLQQWVTNVCLLTFVVMCMYILIFLMCLVYDKNICYIHTSSWTEFQGWKKSRQREPKIFLEYKMIIAISTDHKRKRKKSYIEKVMQPMHCTHSFYSKAKAWGRKEPPGISCIFCLMMYKYLAELNN